ncbi:hypothetical protein [Clostridium botulinum]|uniref:hypothetical protein n=1 Tax=Clostridium botulinum TaxID=1491 RepID=UPI001C9ABE0E|nr:hypothetical protein [Clostridium botulinum]MBY6842837.1 hypothetical protein [Clostridium botulinum]MBY6942941.1 hypothetical protein [Clostridium botulinum]
MNKFNQLCVLQGVTLGDSQADEFVNFIKTELNTRVKFCEEVITQGNVERQEEGGRHDLLFYVHDDDISHFAIKRLSMGIRWWEDVVSYNDEVYLYSNEVLDKYPVMW